VQASHLSKPAQASQPDCLISHIELGDVVNVSSSDTKESLELLSLESGRENSSQPLVDDMRELSLSSSAGSDLSWFLTRFESKGAHRCKEQWHTTDTRVYTGPGLCEDEKPTSCVHQCIMIHWVETPLPLLL
jgi:hypothetical protein